MIIGVVVDKVPTCPYKSLKVLDFIVLFSRLGKSSKFVWEIFESP